MSLSCLNAARLVNAARQAQKRKIATPRLIDPELTSAGLDAGISRLFGIILITGRLDASDSGSDQILNVLLFAQARKVVHVHASRNVEGAF